MSIEKMEFNKEHDRDLKLGEIFVDGKKLYTYVIDHRLHGGEIGDLLGKSRAYVRDVSRRGWCNKVMLKHIVEALNELTGDNLEPDYFEWIEPVEEEIKELSEENECSIDLADIQLSLNKIEALLLEQNKLLNTAINKHIVVKSSPAQAWDRLTNK